MIGEGEATTSAKFGKFALLAKCLVCRFPLIGRLDIPSTDQKLIDYGNGINIKLAGLYGNAKGNAADVTSGASTQGNAEKSTSERGLILPTPWNKCPATTRAAKQVMTE